MLDSNFNIPWFYGSMAMYTKGHKFHTRSYDIVRLCNKSLCIKVKKYFQVWLKIAIVFTINEWILKKNPKKIATLLLETR